MQLQECRPQRRQVQQPEADRHVQPKHADRLVGARGHFRLGLLDPCQQFLAAGVEDLAFDRQRQLAGRAVQQAHAEPRFQIADQPNRDT